MAAQEWILLQLTVLVALKPISPYQVLLAALHELAHIIVRLDVLYPLEDLLVLFQNLIHLTDSNGMIQRWYNLVSSIKRARLGRRLEVPLPLRHQRLLACIAF